MYKLHVSANSGHHQVYYRFSEEVIHVGGGIDKEISCINFSRNIWCGYCNQYENYILSVTCSLYILEYTLFSN